MSWVVVPGAEPEHAKRFEAKFCVGPLEECWLWTAAPQSRYGRLFVGGRSVYAHVLSWSLANQLWPEPGQVVRHSCDTPKCVNPNHLLIGTDADNVADMVSRGRHRHNPALDRGPATVCVHGHDLTLPAARCKRAKTKQRPYGGECRLCDLRRKREANAARRAERAQ